MAGQTEAELKVLADNAYSSETSYNNSRFIFDENGHTTAPYSGGTQPTYYYNQVINHLNNMMQYSGDTAYIDEMFVVLGKIRSIATQNVSANVGKFNSAGYFNDGYYDWPSSKVVEDLWEGHGMRNIFEFLYWLKSYEADYFPEYETQYNVNLAYFKANLVDKWISRGYNRIFQINTWMSSHIPYMCYFLSKITSGADQTTYENLYKAFIGDGLTMTSIAASSRYDAGDNFKDHLFIDGTHGGYSWYGNWNESGAIGDINHQNAEVELKYNMYLDGYLFTATDIDRLVTTIKAVFDNSPNADFLNIPFRSNAIYNAADDNRNFVIPGWSKLTGHDSALEADYYAILNTSTINAGHYLPVFYSDRLLGKARINNTIAKPLFGSTVVTPPVIPDMDIFNKGIIKMKKLLLRRN